MHLQVSASYSIVHGDLAGSGTRYLIDSLAETKSDITVKISYHIYESPRFKHETEFST